MKRAWIVNHYAQVPGGPGGTRHFMLAKFLRERGWECCVLAASVELNTQRQRLNAGEPVRIEEKEGVRFCWVRTPSYQGSGARRILNMLAFARGVLSGNTTRGLPPPDLILGSTVHPFAAAAAARLARRHAVPFVFEVRDIWPETLIALGRLRPSGPAAVALRRLEAWLCHRACRIVAVMPGYAGHAAAYGVDPARVAYIPNGVDLSEVGPVAPWPDSAPFRIVYLGAHGTANDLGTLLEAMEIVERTPHRREIRCDLIGDGPLKAQLEREAARRGLKIVDFLPPVPKSGVYALGAETHAFVLCARALPSVYRYGVSMNKLYDYMAMGRPVIAALSAINDPVRAADAGMTVAPGHPEELAAAIVGLAGRGSAELQRLGLNGRRHVEEYHDMRALAGRLAAVFDACLAV